MLNKQLSGAVFERVVHIEGRQRDESDFFFRNLQWLLRINLIPTSFIDLKNAIKNCWN